MNISSRSRMLRICCALTCALLTGKALAKDESHHYAIIDLTITGPKGTLRLVKIQETSSARDCQESLRTALERNSMPAAGQTPPKTSCVVTLPFELKGLESNSPITHAYHLRHEAGSGALRFLAGRLVAHDVYFYSFDPGNPAEVCSRLSEKMKAVASNVSCVPPKVS